MAAHSIWISLVIAALVVVALVVIAPGLIVVGIVAAVLALVVAGIFALAGRSHGDDETTRRRSGS
jgi:hypothetical protein